MEKLRLQEGYLPEAAQQESRVVQGLIRNAPGEGSGCFSFLVMKQDFLLKSQPGETPLV